MQKLLVVFCISVMLVGCSSAKSDKTSSGVNEQLQGSVEQLLQQHDKIKDYDIVIAQPYIAVSINVTPWQRYKKKKIADKIEKQLAKQYPNYKVFVSSDIKMKFELEKLREKAPTEQAKSLEKLKKLLKEET